MIFAPKCAARLGAVVDRRSEALVSARVCEKSINATDRPIRLPSEGPSSAPRHCRWAQEPGIERRERRAAGRGDPVPARARVRAGDGSGRNFSEFFSINRPIFGSCGTQSGRTRSQVAPKCAPGPSDHFVPRFRRDPSKSPAARSRKPPGPACGPLPFFRLLRRPCRAQRVESATKLSGMTWRSFRT